MSNHPPRQDGKNHARPAPQKMKKGDNRNTIAPTAEEQLRRALSPPEDVMSPKQVRRFLAALVARPGEARALLEILRRATEGGGP